MKIKVLLLIVFSFAPILLLAQNIFAIKGVTVDTASKTSLKDMTVCVLNAKDSILIDYSYTNGAGEFSFKKLPSGNFILLVSRSKFADYIEKFTLDSLQTTHDFGHINMKLEAILLNEVLIKAKISRVKIKGDTTEFNAGAYVIQPNDKVEDLLKQLPGIQIDNNGKISANGQKVTNVLLDGEEFFGDDPTLVTRNVRADMVDKVQLYDKKSDQSAFTGIEDGQKIRTINIKLKEDKKDGIFGKANAGVGTENYDEGQLIFNRFKNNEKYAAYATIANDGKTGLGNSDLGKIGSRKIEIGDNSLIRTSAGADALDSYDGNYDGKGQPFIRSAGGHYDGKWDDNKQSVNANYQIGSIKIDGTVINTAQQNLPTGLINDHSNESYENYAARQKLNAAYYLQLDTTSDLRISAEDAKKDFHVNNNYFVSSRSADGNLINEQNRSVTNHGNQNAFDMDAFYTKKFKKPRRTFSWALDYNNNQNRTSGYLKSATDFYNLLKIKDSTENVDQLKTTAISNSAFNSNITYTEPLNKTLSVILNYGIGINNSTANRQSFNRGTTGLYNLLDSTYSNNYRFTQLANQVGAILNYSNGITIINFGTQASDVNFKQIDQYTDLIYKRNFIDWTPQLSYWHQFPHQQTLSLFYLGKTTQPTIDQIQPVSANNDPLNIVIGNPDLTPAYSSSLNLNYHVNNILNGKTLLIQGTYSFVTNSIIDNVSTDATSGKSIIQYSNLAGRSPHSYFFFADIGGTVTPAAISLDISVDTRSDIVYNAINGLLNKSSTYLYEGLISLNKSKANKYSLYLSAGLNYTINTFSVQPQYNNNAGGIMSGASARVFLPFKFQISSDVNYSYTAKTQTFDAIRRTILNASLSKSFLKGNNFKFSLSGNDLLNQNLLFNRSVSGNAYSQSISSGIKRYFMFSISWDFTKFKTIGGKS